MKKEKAKYGGRERKQICKKNVRKKKEKRRKSTEKIAETFSRLM